MGKPNGKINLLFLIYEELITQGEEERLGPEEGRRVCELTDRGIVQIK